MIFKLVREEVRLDPNVQFYQYTEQDLAVYTSIPFYLNKEEVLSADGLTITKSWSYDVTDSANLDNIYQNQELIDLNTKVKDYCLQNNIVRGVLTGYFIDNGQEIEIATFTERP